MRARRMVQSMLRVGVRVMWGSGKSLEKMVESSGRRGVALNGEEGKPGGNGDREGPTWRVAPVAMRPFRMTRVWGEGFVGIFGRTIRILGCL